MWFEPLAEVGTLLAGCAAMLGAAMPVVKKNCASPYKVKVTLQGEKITSNYDREAFK
ncbi:hypothetical protein [Leisingera aquimarina]|uniref:hypothetical protein n=1 Tax=Leisingera aquimarina TaxID=476529 RepID=UPI0004099762|nr:hypothetical protein [Leisingera aquimarina]